MSAYKLTRKNTQINNRQSIQNRQSLKKYKQLLNIKKGVQFLS